MATINVPLDPSMADLRAMLGGTATTTTQAATQESQPTTSETAAAEEGATEQHTEAAAETVETKPNPQEEHEEPLPEGVQKRIAKEVEKATRIQSEIDRAVSTRKAKEAELAKLKETATGAEPVTTLNNAATHERPKRPEPGEPGHENETWAQFKGRETAYDQQLTDFVKAEAVREINEQTITRDRQKTALERWDTAVAKHKTAGVDFPALMESARQVAQEGLQVAISSLDHWDVVAVHLAKNPEKLKELAATFNQNPNKAIATLGRIEAALTAETKPATTEKPLPEPIRKVGGSASASGQDLQSQLENGSMGSVKALIGKIRGKK